MIGFITNRFKSKSSMSDSGNILRHRWGRIYPFMRFYLPVRHVFVFLGTSPGMIFVWAPFLALCSLWAPELGNAVLTPIGFFIEHVYFMFGDHMNYPKLSLFLLLIFPSLFAYKIILLENLILTFFHNDDE